MNKEMDKRKKPAIRTILNRYVRILAICAFLIALPGTLCGIFSVWTSYEQNECFLNLTEFFQQLDQEKNDFYSYVLNLDGADETGMIQRLTVLNEMLEEIGTYKISTTYKRDIDDLKILMGEFSHVILESVKTEIRTQKEEIRTLYGNGLKCYEAMKHMEDSLYGEYMRVRQKNLLVWRRGSGIQVVIILIIFFLLYLFLHVQSSRISGQISEPIETLAGLFKKMSYQEEDQIFPLSESGDYYAEVLDLINAYNRTGEKLKQQSRAKEELAQAKYWMKKQELNYLQQQINPHFLFNTLNMISHSAYLENDIETVELIDMTANFLRYALDYSGREVTLRQEIEAIGNYVALQEHRFGKRIRFAFHLDERFHFIKMPSLILQPLIENTIIHGLGMYQTGGRVDITTEWLEEEHIGKLSVADNGEGFSEENLERLLAQIKEITDGDPDLIQRRKDGIGVINVFQRLYTYFHGNVRMEITSEPHVRTEIALYLPCDVEINDEN